MSDDPVHRLNTALDGRYRIERELGEGGMATVYLADDLRHDRKVAIKVLKSELSAVIGAERFLAEIKTTANLQHPHILALFDSGEADSFLFYVMPYVEGESLRDRIDRLKQLPVDEAVHISSHVASALDYAHRQGVIHRDIKPANILLHDGEPVVADFGIALAVSNAGGGRLTETGLSLGTPHYMSPEQATADRELNAQSDIYALACVTYEMLTGAPPFAAPTAQAVLMQILTEEPKPVTAVRKSVPPHVEATLGKALEKLPADRFSTAEAFGKALRDPGATEARRAASAAPATPAGTVVGWKRLVWPGIAAVMTVAAVLAWTGRGKPERQVTRLVIPTGNEAGVAENIPRSLSISPDGRTLIYMQDDPSGSLRTYARDLASDQARRIFDAQIVQAAFSPSSEQVLLHDGANLRVQGREGGGTAILTSNVQQISTVLWSRDDWIYYTDLEGALQRVRPDGSQPETISLAEGVELAFPRADLPEANALIVESPLDQSVGVLDLASGELTRIHAGREAWVVEDEYLAWVDDGRLLGQRLDPKTGSVSGTAVDLLGGTSLTSYIGVPLITVSRSGTLVYVPGNPGQDPENLVAVSRDGVRATRNISVRSDLGLTISPQGDRITFEERPDNRGDVYVVDLVRGLKTRLTFGAGAVYPTWTPDGERVAYYRIVDGEYGLYWRPWDGSGVEEVLLDSPGREIEVRFFPDGERILVRQGDRSAADGTDLWVYRIGEPDSGRAITSGGGNEVAPRLSPDGRYVAYATDELGPTQQVFVRSIEDPRERWQISHQDGGNEPLWNHDGTELYYRRSGVLMAVSVETEPAFRRLSEPVELFSTVGLTGNTNHTAYDLMPDGQAFLFIEGPQGTETHIVINWVEELRRRLGR
jgi:serine/threonine-protein kinase